jgi:hypothetical protein
MDPPSCTVGEPRKSYWGEHSFPLFMQNAHRYMLFLSLAVLAILWYDALPLPLRRFRVRRRAFRHRGRVAGADGHCVLLSLLPAWLSYAATSLGGCVDQLSKAPMGSPAIHA